MSETPASRTARIYVLIDLAAGRTISWTTAGVTFTLTNPVLVGSRVSFQIEAHDARGPLPVDDEYGFVNPPLMVPDGGTRIEIDPITGEQTTVATFVRAPLQAARIMVEQTVLWYARQKGWTP